MSTFITGWDTTFLGFFCWGGAGYCLTEYFRRFISTALDAGDSLEIPIIIAAAGLGACLAVFVIAPFESVRIKTVSDPVNYGGSFFNGAAKLVKEEGALTLFDAAPAFLLKEVPFAMAKFAIFDSTSVYLFSQFPVAREDLKLSLAVSLASGCLGGIVAAVISNPADCVVSEMKKAKIEEKKKGGGERGSSRKGGKAKQQQQKSPAVAGWSNWRGQEKKSADMTAVTVASETAVAVAAVTGVKPGAYQVARRLYDEGGAEVFLRGLGLRMGFYSLTVSIQFCFYDSLRVLLGIGRDDLSLYLDVLGGALKDNGVV